MPEKTGLRHHIFGVKCVGCKQHKPLGEFVGCSRCGEPYCRECTAGGPESRICTPCESETNNG